MPSRGVCPSVCHVVYVLNDSQFCHRLGSEISANVWYFTLYSQLSENIVTSAIKSWDLVSQFAIVGVSLTSPISPAKLGQPILHGFCTTTQLRDVIIYSGRRLSIFNHFVFTGGRIFHFYRATRMHSADYAVARCFRLSVCPSSCPSVCQ